MATLSSAPRSTALMAVQPLSRSSSRHICAAACQPVLWYLLLDSMGLWALVCCGMSVHCVL